MKKNEKTKKTSSKKTEKKEDLLSWYEIPTADLDRAVQFYSSLFNINFEVVDTGNHTMAFFPEISGIGGALVYGDGCVPSQSGPLLYLSAAAGLDAVLGRIDASGGQVLMGKTLITDEIGYYALILDSEGNRLALTSKS